MNLEQTIGNTPLVELQRINPNSANTLLVKLEGNNPAGSVKDRPAFNLIHAAEKRGELHPDVPLIEATSGNTGIALAMVCAVKGYQLTLIMPENSTDERKQSMTAYGARLILVSEKEGMEGARDLALDMQNRGEGKVLNQFDNPDNWRAHYQTTAPEIWRDTQGEITHFISAMGTTGTITGCGRYFTDMHQMLQTSNKVQIIGLQPSDNSRIPGIRRWPQAFLPKIFQPQFVDEIRDVHEQQAIQTMHELAKNEGIFAGVSSGGNVYVAQQISRQVNNAIIVAIICDRGDRYLSSNVFA